MGTKRVKIRKPDDFHCHLRRGEILKKVVGFTARQFRRAIVEPNTNPPILTAKDALAYHNEIVDCCGEGFEPLMTIQITDQTTPAMIRKAKKVGVVAGKVYPQGVTTNSQNGVSDFGAIIPVLAEMQIQNMPALFHGESPEPGVFCMDREECFILTLLDIAEEFPRLKIVLEHITTQKAVEAVKTHDNLAATITAHHLLLTLDDVVGGLISPHNFCKPIAKRPEDREALLIAATSGRPDFFFGSDSAPHYRVMKECCCGCAGIFSAPVALPLLAQVFEMRGALDRLEPFTSEFGAMFYGLPQNEGQITLVKKNWVVPAEYGGIVPFMAGQTLPWQVAD